MNMPSKAAIQETVAFIVNMMAALVIAFNVLGMNSSGRAVSALSGLLLVVFYKNISVQSMSTRKSIHDFVIATLVYLLPATILWATASLVLTRDVFPAFVGLGSILCFITGFYTLIELLVRNEHKRLLGR